MEEFFVFYKFAFPSTLLLTPCPTAVSAATCVLSNSTYKLSISTDIIAEIQVTKLLKKLLTESLTLDIFLVKIYDAFKSSQLFDKVIDKFSAAKARKLELDNCRYSIRFSAGPKPHHVHVFSHMYDMCLPRKSHFYWRGKFVCGAQALISSSCLPTYA